MSDKFDYQVPVLLEFKSVAASGVDSCYVDCTSDELCTSDDEI